MSFDNHKKNTKHKAIKLVFDLKTKQIKYLKVINK